MNLNIYLEDPLAKQLSECAKHIHKSKARIIHEALEDWIKRHQFKAWPSSIMNFDGISEAVAFETSRSELLPPHEDPFN